MKFGIITSGGDSPGMNAALRGFVRNAAQLGHETYAFRNGYQGIIDNDVVPLLPRDVGGIIQTGGTIIGTSRSDEFMTQAGRLKALAVLDAHSIHSLCVIGGDGSFRGLSALVEMRPELLVAGVPGTIDNDIPGTEYTLGFSTAVANAVWAMDKLRDTAHSHGRIFLVEVMGRHSGQIAVAVALASGAEDVLVPEEETNLAEVVRRLLEKRRSGKKYGLIVVAEGDDAGGAMQLAEAIGEACDIHPKVAILGHIQRGGSPSVEDRNWGTRMGSMAAGMLHFRESGHFTAVQYGRLTAVPLAEANARHRGIRMEDLSLIRALGN